MGQRRSKEKRFDLIDEFYVYQLRLENQDLPFYVGKGREDRFKDHISTNSLKHKSHKNNVIKKALMNQVAVLAEFLETDLNETDAFTFEKFYISLYGRLDKGTGCLTNKTDGGEGSSGLIHTEEQNQKVSAAMKSFWQQNPDLAIEYSHRVSGDSNPMYGVSGVDHPRHGQTNSEQAKAAHKAKTSGKLNHNYGLKPWDNFNTINNHKAISIWGLADVCRNNWVESFQTIKDGFGPVKMAKSVGMDFSKTFQNMIDMFREGWNPIEDQDWLNKFKGD